MIYIQNEQTFPVSIQALQEDTQKLLDAVDYQDFDISIALVSPEAMQNYNKQYRDKDKVTDILSFPFHEMPAGERIQADYDEEKNLGDIILCPQHIHDDLERWNMTFEQRMKQLLVHGICHLLGYDHIEDEDYNVMKEKEEWLLEKIQ